MIFICTIQNGKEDLGDYFCSIEENPNIEGEATHLAYIWSADLRIEKGFEVITNSHQYMVVSNGRKGKLGLLIK